MEGDIALRLPRSCRAGPSEIMGLGFLFHGGGKKPAAAAVMGVPFGKIAKHPRQRQNILQVLSGLTHEKTKRRTRFGVRGSIRVSLGLRDVGKAAVKQKFLLLWKDAPGSSEA
jgi:hypothetical protein